VCAKQSSREPHGELSYISTSCSMPHMSYPGRVLHAPAQPPNQHG
jgi:hypothetical protein